MSVFVSERVCEREYEFVCVCERKSVRVCVYERVCVSVCVTVLYCYGSSDRVR